MLTILWLLLTVALIGGLIYLLESPDRYSQMSEEEFEEEAKKKSSLLGAAMVGFEKALRPDRVEQVMKQKQMKKEEAEKNSE